MMMLIVMIDEMIRKYRSTINNIIHTITYLTESIGTYQQQLQLFLYPNEAKSELNNKILLHKQSFIHQSSTPLPLSHIGTTNSLAVTFSTSSVRRHQFLMSLLFAHHNSPCFGSASTHRFTTSACCSTVPYVHSNR